LTPRAASCEKLIMSTTLRTDEEPKRVLAVLHGEQSTPGRLRRLLAARGYSLDIRRPCFGDPLPETLQDHAAAIIFGGAMCANDPDAFIRREIEWIGVPLKEEKPFLGICLGAQMFARHLGHRVYRHPDERVEVGYYEIEPTADGDLLTGEAFPRRVYHWHEDGFDLPHGATLLARGGEFETQACRYGSSAVALQFHPEVTYACMCRWTVASEQKLARPGALPAQQHFADWHLYDPPVARWMNSFLDRWLAGQLGESAVAAAA
jgi:GMP synthase (glutamine-hydrolysing)